MGAGNGNPAPTGRARLRSRNRLESSPLSLLLFAYPRIQHAGARAGPGAGCRAGASNMNVFVLCLEKPLLTRSPSHPQGLEGGLSLCMSFSCQRTEVNRFPPFLGLSNQINKKTSQTRYCHGRLYQSRSRRAEGRGEGESIQGLKCPPPPPPRPSEPLGLLQEAVGVTLLALHVAAPPGSPQFPLAEVTRPLPSD